MKDEWMGMLLQFSDSTLPVGSYAHSFGLEGFCQTGLLTNEKELRTFLLRDARQSLLTVDLPMMKGAFLAREGDVSTWDEQAWAMRPTQQLRDAVGRIGRQTWQLYQRTWREKNEPVEFPYFQASVVSGVIFSERGVSLEAALWTVAYQNFTALVQSALKLQPIGPGIAQTLLHDAMQSLDFSEMPDEPGSFNPLWDIAASRHERTHARLFIS